MGFAQPTVRRDYLFLNKSLKDRTGTHIAMLEKEYDY